MRFFLLRLLPLLALLAACTKSSRPVRLDFIGSARFTSSNRTAGPGDTLSTRLYASGADTTQPVLRHFRATVTYSPTRNPVVYPTPATTLKNVPDDAPLVFYDADLTGAAARQLVYQVTFGTRTTSGHENWEFTVTDADNNESTRRFRVRVSNPDSLADYHQYVLRIPAAPAQPARPYVALRPGLALPASAIAADTAARRITDLLYLPGATALTVYENPDHAARAELRRTPLDSVGFLRLNTTSQIVNAFTAGTSTPFPVATSTGGLTRRQVIAFRTADHHQGVFFVRRLAQAPYPVLELLVRVSKQAN